MPPVIECRHLTKRYGRARGIEDISFTVERGEIFGFLGPNGAGKTTTIRTLTDLHRPTAGEALLFGLDSRRDSRRVRARIGNLAGDFALAPHVTGQRALALAAQLRGVHDLALGHELAERFQADLARPMKELSRGNRQKVGLILALFHRPELLIFDEPTAGLDPLMQSEFLRLLAEERDRGTTVLLSSHDLDEVQQVCGRVAMVREGRLVGVERVAAMRARASRNLRIVFASEADAGRFARVGGVERVEQDGAVVRCQAPGDLDRVITALHRVHVEELEIARPTLDELFVSYYRAPVAA